MAAAAAAASSVDDDSAPAAPSYCTLLAAQSPLLWSARFPTAALMQAHPPRGWDRGTNACNKSRIWKRIQNRDPSTRVPAGTVAGEEERQLRVARYDGARMQMNAAALLTTNTQFEIVRSVYGYEDPADLVAECHWWVNFADKHLFAFYASSLFAQDEWQCMEIPALACLREFLAVYGRSDPAAAPLTVASSVPTPVLVMNAPREVSIDAVGSKIYGNSFSVAKSSVIDAATTLLPNPTLTHVIAMEACKGRYGLYTTRDIAVTLQTAITAFIGAREQAALEWKTRKADKEPTVIVHTGNWGCGAFGGNTELMCMLQLIAARIAGLTRVVYHVLSADNEAICLCAAKKLDELLVQLKAEAAAPGAQPISIGELATRIAAMEYEWGVGNGT